MDASSSRPSFASTAAFVFSLCLPYVAATPLPTGSGPAALSLDSETPMSAAMDVLRRGTRFALDHLDSRSIVTIPTSALVSNTTHPIVAIARLDSTGLYHIPEGFVMLRQQFNGGFIVLSYAIAFVGSLCTLELLIRRTTNSGWRNQALLTSAGFTFGAVSTFAMHFIFNNSLSLHHPMQARKDYPSLRLAYDPGFTVLSLITSCLAMTIAFFVMGTSLQDWWCFPGVRRRRRGSSVSESRSRKNSASAVDEYGKWKDTQSKKVLRRGTIGMGALLHKAAAGAKWSMMDGDGETESKRPSWGADGKGAYKKNSKGDMWDNSDHNALQRDKNLEELDFRLGRSAVKLELERRHDGDRTPSPSSIRRNSINSAIQPMKSISSLPQTPLPTFYPPTPSTRRGSIPASFNLANDSQVFTPGFNFPPRDRDDAASSTTHLLNSAPNSGHPLDQEPNWPSSDGSPASLPDLSKRRASLPVATSTGRSEPLYRQSGLSRIQSLPEADQEIIGTSVSSQGEYVDKQRSHSPTLSISAKLDTLHDPVPVTHTKKRVEFKTKPVFTKVEKFLGFDVVTRDEIIKIFITGTIAGCGVCGMHYIGQLSITGMPYIAYKVGYVVGSVVIACGAVVTALYIMFIMLRPKLKHTWLSKIAVALILAIAVCAMHFCGMQGTIYAWPVGQGISPAESMLVGTNRVITAIVACLAFLACIACAVFFALHSLKLRRERARRRRVVVAAVFLDDHDRVLVNSTDGMLPMCDIASLSGHGEMSSSRRSFKSTNRSFGSDSTVLGMDLTPGHDAFVSALKMSWAWRNPKVAPHNSFAPLSEKAIVSGQQTLADTIADIRRGSVLTMESSITSGRQMRLSVAKFLERFAVSSGQLATQLVGQQDGITRLGVLYDQILTTGWVKLTNSNDTVSKGQLIFLVRRVTSAMERNDLLSKHFIFADSHAVASALHKTLSVPVDHTVPLLDDIRLFCDSTLRSTLKPGIVYAGLAVVQATPFDGLRILLEKTNRAQLPMRELCAVDDHADSDALSGTIEELGEAILWLDGMDLLSIVRRNMALDIETPGPPRVAQMLHAVERALVPMLDEMLDSNDMIHLLPRLHIHPMLIPLTPGGTKKTSKLTGYVPPYVVVFYANYDAAVNTFTDKWLPFSLFKAQNSCVMAPKIAAAAKAEGLGRSKHADRFDEIAAEEAYHYERRPSKVQFELDDAAPLGQPAQVAQVASVEGGIFGGFAFPPKSPDAPKGIVKSGAQDPPRRSSLAGKSRFSALIEKEDKEYKVVSHHTEEVCSGVAGWDAEWLLNLLRSRLTAEA